MYDDSLKCFVHFNSPSHCICHLSAY